MWWGRMGGGVVWVCVCVCVCVCACVWQEAVEEMERTTDSWLAVFRVERENERDRERQRQRQRQRQRERDR